MMREQRVGYRLLRATLLAITLLVLYCTIVAWGDTGHVYDQAGLLTAQEIQSLEVEAAALEARMKMSVILVTTADAQGKDAQNYADDFYDQGGFGTRSDKSGVLFLIDMDNRTLYISTSGAMIRFLTDSRIEAMLDNAYDDASEGEYNQVMSQFLRDTEEYYKKGIPGGQYNYDTETGKISVYHSIRWYEALLALAVAAFCGAGACMNVKRQYAMKSELRQSQNYLMSYRGDSKFTYAAPVDAFLTKSVSQMLIPRSNGGGGGRGGGGGGFGGGGMSSTHTSSGGGTHGGGGRSF